MAKREGENPSTRAAREIARHGTIGGRPATEAEVAAAREVLYPGTSAIEAIIRRPGPRP